MTTKSGADKTAEIRSKLQNVIDPELDESVIDMDFITTIDVDAGDRVHIEFRLPTYWCAANFAYMMAEDIRSEVGELAWVRDVSVVLGEHMYADTINNGMARRQSFQDAFGDEADGNLEDVRRTFLLKAFQRRQEALLLHALSHGADPARLVELEMSGLDDLVRDDTEGRRLLDRYLQRRFVAGPAEPSDLAFITAEGEPVHASSFEYYLKSLRRVRINGEFNGALCRGLLSARFDTDTPLAGRAK